VTTAVARTEEKEEEQERDSYEAETTLRNSFQEEREDSHADDDLSDEVTFFQAINEVKHSLFLLGRMIRRWNRK